MPSMWDEEDEDRENGGREGEVGRIGEEAHIPQLVREYKGVP